MIVMNCTFTSSGSSAICTTALATCATSMRRLRRQGAVRLRHAAAHPGGHVRGGVADVDLAAGDVEGRPSSEIDLVSPVIACLEAV